MIALPLAWSSTVHSTVDRSAPELYYHTPPSQPSLHLLMELRPLVRSFFFSGAFKVENFILFGALNFFF